MKIKYLPAALHCYNFDGKLKVVSFLPKKFIIYISVRLVECYQRRVYKSTYMYMLVQLLELELKFKHVAVYLIPYIF